MNKLELKFICFIYYFYIFKKEGEQINIVIPLKDEKYKEYIDRILSTRNNKKDRENYQEKHHILPKSMGRTNSEDNLIYLYAQEHYYAHKLLAQENPSEKKLQFAWWNMCQCTSEKRNGCRISEEDYAEARIAAAKANSDIKKGKPLSKEHKEKLKGHGKPVINLTTGKTYVSAYSASEETGVLASHIGDCCNGRVARAG